MLGPLPFLLAFRLTELQQNREGYKKCNFTTGKTIKNYAEYIHLVAATEKKLETITVDKKPNKKKKFGKAPTAVEAIG